MVIHGFTTSQLDPSLLAGRKDEEKKKKKKKKKDVGNEARWMWKLTCTYGLIFLLIRIR